MEPDFDLGDVDRMAAEVDAAAALGLRAVVDAMPCDCRPQRREAGRAVAADRDPRRRPDRAPPRALLRTGPLERDRAASRPSPTCSSSTSPTASTRTTTRARSSAGRRTGPASSRSPAATAGRRRATARSSRRRPRRTTGPASPILTHCEAGTGALEQVGAPRGPRRRPVARRPQPRRQGRRPRLPPRAAGDRGVRGVRPVVPLGRRRRTARSSLLEWAVEDGLVDRHRARHGRGAAGLLPRLRWVARPDLAARRVHGRAWRAAGIDADVRQRLFVDNPARAFAFAATDGGTA